MPPPASASSGALMGPTFAQIPFDERPTPLPACATCPKAMWYRTPRMMRAFCRELRSITWQDGEAEPVLECDGREAALSADAHG